MSATDNQDTTKKLNQLIKRREELTARQARIQFIKEQTLADKAKTIEEMKENQTSPETIAADVDKLEKEQAAELERVQKEFDDLEKEVAEAEKSLEQQK